MDFPTLEQLRVSQCFKCKIANTHLWFKEGFAHTVCYDEWIKEIYPHEYGINRERGWRKVSKPNDN